MASIRSTRFVRSAIRVAVMTLALAALVVPLTAHAGVITNWRSTYPMYTVGTNIPVTVQANSAVSPDPLVSSSLKLYIDGALVPRQSYTASVLPTSIYIYHVPQPVLTDGLHTFRVEVSDSAGRLSAKQWTATVKQAPTAAWVAPATNEVIDDGRPTIVMSLADNTPGTTFTVSGQVRSGTAAGPVVATFGGTGAGALQSFSLPSELATGTYFLTATVSDGAGTPMTLQGATARKFVTAAFPAMTEFTSCDACHSSFKTAHATPEDANCVACHQGYDGQHSAPYFDCTSCHDGWHISGAKAAVRVTAPCVECHTASRSDIPRHTTASVDSSHQGSCGGCHEGSLIERHAVTPAGSAYPNQCGLCHSSSDADVLAAIADGDTSCEACHGQQHGDITAAHTFSAMGASCQGSNCHVKTLPEAHAKFVGPGKRYPQYADSCDLCHENEDPDRVDLATDTADCSSCHSETHGDVTQKHLSPTNATCFGAGCHDASKDLPTVHAPYAGEGTEYGYETTCDLCHANRDPQRINWDTATARCTGSCHSGSTHSQYASRHAVTSASAGCTNCHGTDISTIHGVVSPNFAKCATCHARVDNYTKTADCGSCHDLDSPHGDDRAIHQPAASSGVVSMFGNHDGMGPLSVWADCDMCHGPVNLLDVHDNNCATCHPGPRNTFTTWNRTCQQAGCHATVHASAESGHAAEEAANCDNCHNTDWSVPIENCGGCHTLVDSQAPVTTSNVRATYVGPATIALAPADAFPTAGIARTLYTLDGAATVQGTQVIVPAPASGTQSHSLSFKSEDLAGHVETTKTVSFTVTADTQAPVTTSNAKASYSGIARVQLSATDNATQNGVKATYYRLDGGPVTQGTLVVVPNPASATTHTLEFWSVDTSDIEESHNIVTFGQSNDTLPPVTTTSGLNKWHTFYRMWVTLYATDVGDSGVAASYAQIDNGPIMGGPSTGTYILPASSYTVTDGMHTFKWWSVDAAGNIESVNSTGFGVDQSGPVITTDAKTSYTGAASITATATDSISGVDTATWMYRLNGGVAQPGNSVVVPAPATGTANNTLTFFVKNGAGTQSNRVLNFTITAGAPDTVAPTGTMSVDSGSEYTSSTAATVVSNVTDAAGVTQMCIDPGTGTYGSWLTYQSSRAITLPATVGLKTVRVQYRDAAGNVLTLTDTVTYDNVAPTGTMSIAGGAAKISSPNTTVDSDVSDAASGMGEMRIDPGTGVWSEWAPYAAVKSITVPADLGMHTVEVQYRDRAGNVTSRSDTVELAEPDATAPTTTSNGHASYVGTATITLNGSDPGGSGVATTYYRLDSGPQMTGSTVVVAPPASGTVSHTLEFWSVDFAGNIETPPQSLDFQISPLGATSQEYVFTGADQLFTVPAGVTSVLVDMHGGQGGDFDGYTGGLGGYVQAAIPVSPGDVLTIKVGGAGDGTTSGAWPNGGAGGGTCGGSGGGSSSVRLGSVILAEAGGGGGADHEGYNGGDGGSRGWLPGGGEFGGSDSGAGGGGGWNGGAGYAEHDGGGDGGTSYVAVGTELQLVAGARLGDGRVRLTWTTADDIAPVTTSNAQATYTGSATVALTATDAGGAGVKQTYYRLDGGAQQTGTSVTVNTSGTHTLEFWSEDITGNIESPHKSVTFMVTIPMGTIQFAWDNPVEGSWADVWVRDHLGNVVYQAESGSWTPDGWFVVSVPVSPYPYELTAHWYDADADREDETYSSALVDAPGKVVTWYY